MKAISVNSLTVFSKELDHLSSLLDIAFVVAIAKRKRPARVAHYMWCARRICGRWLG